MASLPNLSDKSARKARYPTRPPNTPPHTGDPHFASHTPWFSPHLTGVFAWPATGSLQPSESSETTLPGGFHDGGTLDDASSVTLLGGHPWHEIEVGKYTQRIPSAVVPALLQGASHVSPPSQDKAGEDDVVLPRYSAEQKGKWKARTDDSDSVQGSPRARSERSRFNFQDTHHSVERWIIHNRPILQEYANRQASLPLGRRLEVSIDEHPRFILGTFQLLVNRDQRGTDRSRQLGPQLIENFVDIGRWAKDYFRSRHGTQVVDNEVSTLLTIVMNNFYEGQVQLIDRIVEFAFDNMRSCSRSSLKVEDFAFGFDFKMSQDMPFYVETYSHIREPLPFRAAKVQPTPEIVMTSSGRQVKPSKRAQEASNQVQIKVGGKRKGKNTSQVKNKKAASGSAQPAPRKKSPARPSSDCTVPDIGEAAPAPPKTTLAHTKHISARPSNLGLPPIAPGSSSVPKVAPQRLDDISKSKGSEITSAEGPKVSGSSGSSLKDPPLPRLRILLPARPTFSVAGLTLSDQTCTPASPIRGRVTGSRGRTRNWNGRGRARDYKNGSLMESTTAPGVRSINPHAQPSAHLVGEGNAVTFATVTGPVVPSITLVDTSKTITSNAEPHERTGQPLSNSDSQQRKKRKLDDCED